MGAGIATSLGAGGGMFSSRSMAGDMAGNMALMSNNPYLMAAGGFQKASNAVGNMTGGSLFGNAPETALWGLIQKRDTGGPKKWDVLDSVAASANELATAFGKVSGNLNTYYGGKWRGFEEKKRQDELMKKHGFKGDYADLETGRIGLDMSATGKVTLAKKLGQKGLKTLSNRIGGEKALAKAAAIRAIRKTNYKGEITEDMLEKSEQYSKLKRFEAVIDRLIMVFKKDLNINIKTVSGQSPGDRVNGYSIPAATEFAPGGAFGA